MAAKVTNVRQPIHLDASEPRDKWAGLTHNSCDVVVAINLLQYSSFTTAQVNVFIYVACYYMLTHLKIVLISNQFQTYILLFYCAYHQGLFIGAGQILKEDGILIIYGASILLISQRFPWRNQPFQKLGVNIFVCSQAYAMNGMITPSCNEDLDAEIKKM